MTGHEVEIATRCVCALAGGAPAVAQFIRRSYRAQALEDLNVALDDREGLDNRRTEILRHDGQALTVLHDGTRLWQLQDARLNDDVFDDWDTINVVLADFGFALSSNLDRDNPMQTANAHWVFPL